MTEFEVDFADDNGLRRPSEEMFVRWFPEIEMLLKNFKVKKICIEIEKTDPANPY